MNITGQITDQLLATIIQIVIDLINELLLENASIAVNLKTLRLGINMECMIKVMDDPFIVSRLSDRWIDQFYNWAKVKGIPY